MIVTKNEKDINVFVKCSSSPKCIDISLTPPPPKENIDNISQTLWAFFESPENLRKSLNYLYYYYLQYIYHYFPDA